MASKRLLTAGTVLTAFASFTSASAAANDLGNVTPEGAMALGFPASDTCIIDAINTTFPERMKIMKGHGLIQAEVISAGAKKTVSVFQAKSGHVTGLSVDFGDRAGTKTFGGTAFANTSAIESNERVLSGDTLYTEHYGGVVDVGGEAREFYVQLQKCNAPALTS